MKTWELVNFSEIDDFAVGAYTHLHNITLAKNLGDITTVNTDDISDCTMLCGGSPCQDFSAAGEQGGAIWTCVDCKYEYNPLTVSWEQRGYCPHCMGTNITHTRSSLIVEYLRVLREKHPKFAIYENVASLCNTKFKDTFQLFIAEIQSYGYNIYYRVLNAKDFGIPQNRERLYVVAIDKTIDNGKFNINNVRHKGSTYTLKDFYAYDSVDSNYLSREKAKALLSSLDKSDLNKINGGLELVEKQVVVNSNEYRRELTFPDIDGKLCYLKIRVLPPYMTWLLTGFTKDQFDMARFSRLIKEGDSILSTHKINYSALMKMAGNSIVVDVLYAIYSELYQAIPELFDDLRVVSLFSGIGAFEAALDRLFVKDINKMVTDIERVKEHLDKIRRVYIIDDTYKSRKPRVYDTYSPTLRATRHGFKLLIIGEI